MANNPSAYQPTSHKNSKNHRRQEAVKLKKKILSVLLAALLTVTLSGCNMVSFNVTELMSPPKATGDKAAIQELVDREAGSDHTLKYPQNGSYRSAITTMDIDGDSVEEAVAFYLPAGEAQTVHLLIMDTVDGEWTTIGNHTSKSSMVDLLDFADLDGDGKLEIIVGWSTYNTQINDLSVYLTDGSESTEILSENTYTSLMCDDFTGSGKDELLLLSLYAADKPAAATLITLNDTKNSLYTIDTTELSADIVSFAQIETGEVFDGQFGAVIDGVNSSGAYSTQIIYYSDIFNSLERVYFSGNSPTDQASRRYAVLSKDIDSDGVIEIPNVFKMNIEDNQTDAVPAPLIYWCEYTATDKLVIEQKAAASLVYGFYFTVPDSWGEDFTAYVNYSTNEVIFYEWSDNGLGETLLIIKMFTNSTWADGTSAKGYTELQRNDAYVYAFLTPESNSSKLLTNSEIIDAFSLA